MNRMRLAFAGLLAISLLAPQWAAAQDEPLPKGFEKMFEEIAATMKKYPGATERFAISDSKPDPITIKPRAGSFHACCERSCSGSRCGCAKWCPE